MRIRRRLPIPVAVLLLVAAVALIVTLRKHAPPEAARLLPGADGFFYINLEWVRKFNAASQLPPVSREPEYQKFVEETGFQFERDLDKAAFAIHYPQSWGNGTAGLAAEPRFSEVFVGKIDSTRLTAYLKKISSSIDDYRGFEIYNIPLEGRTVRVVILSYDSVAVSNHPSPDVIRGMLDRSRKLASPFGGPSLLRKFYRRVPLASLSFAILRVQPAEMSSLGGLGGWSLLFPKPARYGCGCKDVFRQPQSRAVRRSRDSHRHRAARIHQESLGRSSTRHRDARRARHSAQGAVGPESVAKVRVAITTIDWPRPMSRGWYRGGNAVTIPLFAASSMEDSGSLYPARVGTSRPRPSKPSTARQLSRYRARVQTSPRSLQ